MLLQMHWRVGYANGYAKERKNRQRDDVSDTNSTKEHSDIIIGITEKSNHHVGLRVGVRGSDWHTHRHTEVQISQNLIAPAPSL